MQIAGERARSWPNPVQSGPLAAQDHGMSSRSTESRSGVTAPRGSLVPGLIGMAAVTVIAPMLGMFGVHEVAKALATFLSAAVLGIIGVRACRHPVGIFGIIVLMVPPLATMMWVDLPPLGGIAHQP